MENKIRLCDYGCDKEAYVVVGANPDVTGRESIMVSGRGTARGTAA